MKFSIITPVYNRADCIQRCIDSVCRNTPSTNDIYSVEHIIVDDGSEDDTFNIVKANACRYTHIHFFRQPQNKGTNAARNKAVTMATGDWCVILDSDDYFCDDTLRVMANVMSEYPQYGHYAFAADDMMPYYATHPLLCKEQQVLNFKNFLLDGISGDFIHVMRTSTLRKYPFDEYLRIYEGVFFLRFYKEVNDVLFTKRVVTIRERNRNDSVTKDVLLTSVAAIERNLKAIELKLKWFGDDYRSFQAVSCLRNLYQKKIDCALQLARYDEIKQDVFSLYNKGGLKTLLFKVIYLFRFGKLYAGARMLLVRIKYKLLKRKVSI